MNRAVRVALTRTSRQPRSRGEGRAVHTATEARKGDGPQAGSSPQVSALPLDDELVLYKADTSRAYVLNATGSHIWSLFGGGHTDASVARELSGAYGVAYREALADVRDLIAQLRHAGLLAH